MSKTIVGVSNSSDPVMVDYVEKQLQAISISFPELAMDRFARYPGRLPAFFILKNGARMGVLQAKLNDDELISWVSSTSG